MRETRVRRRWLSHADVGSWSLFGAVFFRVPRECDLWALSTAQTPAAVDNSNRKLTSLLTNW